jgi:hypothetical protein
VSIDLGQILDVAQPYVDSAIDTVGSEWTILRNPAGVQDKTVNRTTGGATETSPEQTVATGVPGLWVPDSGQGAPTTDGKNLSSWTETGTMLFHSDLVDVQARDVLECTASRDPRLAAGRRFAVKTVPDGSAGVVRQVRCEAWKRPGQ